MIYGIVRGNIVATFKTPKLERWKLLIVQPLSLEDQPQGGAILAVDAVGAGAGEKVLVVREGGSVNQIMGERKAPVQSAVVAIVDEIKVSRGRETK